MKERRFFATKIGKDVTDLLVEHFPQVMDLKFTSHMEEELDQIETKQTHYNEVLNEFWGPFSEALKTAEDEDAGAARRRRDGRDVPAVRQAAGAQLQQEDAPLVRRLLRLQGEAASTSSRRRARKPGRSRSRRNTSVRPAARPMLERMGKTGPFLGCSGYPECKTTMNFDPDGKPVLSAVPTEHICEKCGKPMVLRQGQRGPFLACTGYPKCKNAKDVDAKGNPVKPIDTGIACEKCGSPMTVKKGFRGPFLGCSNYPKCRSTKPIAAGDEGEAQGRCCRRRRRRNCRRSR